MGAGLRHGPNYTPMKATLEPNYKNKKVFGRIHAQSKLIVIYILEKPKKFVFLKQKEGLFMKKKYI